MKKLAILIYLFFFATFLTAQEKIELGGTIGYTNYLGDLVEPVFTFDQSNLAGGVFLRYQLLDQVHVRSNLLIGKLKGDDANYTVNASREASFIASFLELALLAEYDILKMLDKGNKKGYFTPYVFTGLGFSLFNLDRKFGSTSPEVSADLAGQYSDIQVVLPFGLGVKYGLSKNLTVGAEIGMRATFTDYLDGVSKAGDPNDKDVYMSGGVTLSYLFGNSDADKDGIADKKDACPDNPGPAKFNGCPDTDGDGLIDGEDECPNEFGRALLKGCPDSDDDGVPDKFDDCPDDKGVRRFGGCPDTDNDGIVDLEDNCPTEAGIPSLNGCPDADRDGVTDSKDECPLEAGPVHMNGCPDSDNDGLADKDDECPDLPGNVNTNGCPDTDTDQDGIIDRNDRCPELAGPLENKGCPEIEQEDQAVLDLAMTSVGFETGSDVLLSSSLEVLDKIANILGKYKGYHLKINGHADNVGGPEKNKTLSEDRARACYNYLFTKGVKPTLMSYEGFGETASFAGNDTVEGQGQNRRVEFVLTTEEN